jgi:hypothetical protein
MALCIKNTPKDLKWAQSPARLRAGWPPFHYPNQGRLRARCPHKTFNDGRVPRGRQLSDGLNRRSGLKTGRQGHVHRSTTAPQYHSHQYTKCAGGPICGPRACGACSPRISWQIRACSHLIYGKRGRGLRCNASASVFWASGRGMRDSARSARSASASSRQRYMRFEQGRTTGTKTSARYKCKRIWREKEDSASRMCKTSLTSPKQCGVPGDVIKDSGVAA